MKRLLCLLLVICLILTGCAKSGNKNTVGTVPEDAEVFTNNDEPGKVVETDKELFEEIKASNTVSVIYVGRPTCPACVAFYPTIEEVASELKVDFFYTNIDEWEANDINNLLFATLPGITGTPTLAVLYNGKLIDTLKGSSSRASVISFLTNHNIIN